METARAAFIAHRKGEQNRESVWDAACQDIVANVGSTRASVWTFNMLGDVIDCHALFDTRTGEITRGLRLTEEDFPDYFNALSDSYKVVATDAANHPATKCFDELYFIPNDIRSLLDFIIMDGRQPIGVLCCEHTGEIKEWAETDVEYLSSMAAMLAMVFKSQRATESAPQSTGA